MRAVLPLGLVVVAGLVFVCSAILTLAARRLALRIGFVDQPGGHKSHATAMPYAGGCAIFGAVLITLLAGILLARSVPEKWVADHLGELARAYWGGIHERIPQMIVILIGGLALHVVGLLDDRRPMRAMPKLLAIVLVALFVAVVGDVRLGEFAGPAVSILLTTVWFVIIVNAFNFLDNMDGLSAGVAIIALLFLAVCGLMASQVLVPALAAVFLGAVAGFLVFNFPPARIFMGDAGSLVVGYMLATTSVMTTYYRGPAGLPPYALAMPLVILAIPLYDFVSVVGIRLLEGRNPMKGDQRHFSHRLVQRGLSRRFAIFTIYLAAAMTGLAATLLPGANLRETITIVVMVLMVLGIIAILEA